MSFSKSSLFVSFLFCILCAACQSDPDASPNDSSSQSESRSQAEATNHRDQNDHAEQKVASVFIDAQGRKYQPSQPIERVVTIAPGATEIVAAGGGLDKLVGVSNVDSSPVSVLSLPNFSVLPLDFEAIISLRPDLVFASAGVNDPQNIPVFESLGIDVFFLDDSTWPAVYNTIGVVGQLLQTKDKAASAQHDLQARIDSLQQLTSSLSHHPSSVFLIHEATSYSFGKGSYVMDLFAWAGLESATAQMDTPAPVLSDEWMLMEDPEIIFGTFGDDFKPADLLEHHPTWKILSAIKNGRVFSIPQDLILRPGPNNVEAAYLMAEFAHPALFNFKGN